LICTFVSLAAVKKLGGYLTINIFLWAHSFRV